MSSRRQTVPLMSIPSGRTPLEPAISCPQRMDLKPTRLSSSKSIPGALHMADKVHKIRLGVCCMDKKFNSSRAKNVISRIQAYGDIEIIPFGDLALLHRPIEEWPRCDVLIAYFSSGYPMDKVIQYANKYKPCLINDLSSQMLLRDRLSIKNILICHKIPTPRYAVLDRNDASHNVVEYDDKIVVNGVTIRKPFVEKPMHAEDHNIYVYYKGGGSRRLFRKVGNRSSEPSSCSCIRREGRYIYEALIQSNKDIKAYTVGREYVHAETRKAPTVDGIVERDVFNKEVRHKCRLTKYEKKIAQKVVWLNAKTKHMASIPTIQCDCARTNTVNHVRYLIYLMAASNEEGTTRYEHTFENPAVVNGIKC
eukprot:354271_1